MKCYLLIALILIGTTRVKAQNLNKMTNEHDVAAISRALNDYYFKGIYEGDTALLRGIYHKGTLLFGDVKGQPYAKTLDEYFDGVAQPPKP
jgi:hypothetical protein